jgi:hypothetical protein
LINVKVKTIEKKSPLFQFYKKKISKTNEIITFKQLDKFLKYLLFDGFKVKFLPQDDFNNIQELNEFIV